MAKITRQSASATSSMGRMVWPATPPAVLTSTSTRPAASTARATNAAAAPASRTSTTAVRLDSSLMGLESAESVGDLAVVRSGDHEVAARTIAPVRGSSPFTTG